MLYFLQLAGVSKTLAEILFQSAVLVVWFWHFLKKWERNGSQGVISICPIGYAYSMSNEILQGEKDIAQQENSLRKMFNDRLSDEYTVNIAWGQILRQWLKSGKMQHDVV